MTEPSRYDTTEPVIPEWAAPVYLWVAGVTGFAYLLLAIILGSTTGMAVVKALSVVLLASYAGFSKAPLLTLALLLSAAGDYALGIDPPARKAGIGFFAGAHFAYIAIFALMVLKSGFKRDGLILAVALAAFGAAMYWWLSPGMGAMRAPVSAYLVIILTMAILSGFVHGPRLLAVGALLFVLSDSLIAAGWFRELTVSWGRIDLVGAVIWITYFVAQTCLALGVVGHKREEAAATESQTS